MASLFLEAKTPRPDRSRNAALPFLIGDS